jgi:putative membrane protein
MKTMKSITKLCCTLVMGCAGVIAVLPAHAEVTDADKSFLSMAAQSDVNEIAVSKLAEAKATNPRVKAFAHKMVVDHTMLSAKMKPFAQAWGLTPPAGPDGEHQAEIDKLNGLSGMDFDKEYMHAMDMDHHKALDAFTNEVNSTTDMKFKTAVMKGKSVVAAHTSMADSMVAKM